MFVPYYTLLNAAYNNGKPLEVNLNKESFDTYFKTTTELSAKLSYVVAYAQEKKLSYNDEKGWKALIDYYNNY